MSRARLWPLIAVIALTSCTALAATPDSKAQDPKPESDSRKPEGHKFEPFKAEAVTSSGSVTIGGRPLAYQAIAGTLIVHPKGWDDVPRDPASEKPTPAGGDEGGMPPNPSAEAAMFYVAYFISGGGPRPVTFFYNGGPGSATLWLHLGAFGPRRIVTATDKHTPAAPYSLTNNAYSLLDATDMVFIDAPGTGFSRIAGKDKEKAFYGVDADAYAFSEFISQFLSKYGRWNSPTYLFGESYGTPRSAVVVNELEADRSVDLNGVILLSQILNFDLSPDRPTGNPGVDLPYQTVLPTYAATAWYHHKLPAEHASLEALLTEVEQFAMGDYGRALAAGSDLSASDRAAIAEKLHQYTGLPVEYILKADLRIDGGEFRQNLQGDSSLTTGRLDSRFSGPDIDPLSQRADYDPQSASLGSAYVSAFNEYARYCATVKTRCCRVSAPSVAGTLHQLPVVQPPTISCLGTNVMPDRQRHETQSQSQSAAARGVLRPGDALLPGHLRDASPANPAEPAGEHRVQVLRVRPHGVRQGRGAQAAARQRGRLHPPHQQRRSVRLGLGAMLTGCAARGQKRRDHFAG